MSRTATKILLAAIGITILFWGVYVLFTRGLGEIVSPLPLASSLTITATPEPTREPTNVPLSTKKPSRLSGVVAKSLSGTAETYAVVIKNLKTGEFYSQNEHVIFETASLYKLWVMSVVYDFMDQGKLTNDKPLSAGVQVLNHAFDIDPADAELSDGTVNFTVGEALEQMITVSHNYAALLLSYTVKNSSIDDFLYREALDESRTGEPPQTTAADVALFYEKLYKGKIVNTAADKNMLELLSRQQLNDRIPKYLPDSVKVAHKTGEIGGYKHDAGIVFAGGDYIFVVLSKSDNPASAAEREALLSKAVYNYFKTSE